MTPPNAAEVQKFQGLAKSLPDVRKEKIEALRKRIQSGKYVVKAEAIAKKMAEQFHEIEHITHQTKNRDLD